MKRNKKKGWFRPKRYLHLTRQLSLMKDETELLKLVRNPSRVASHAFFPLIHKKLSQRRFKSIGFDKFGCAIRAHNINGKSTKKLRPIHYPTHVDAAIYAYYAKEVIQPKYEAVLDEDSEMSVCITAYRQIPSGKKGVNKNNIHFAKEAFDFIRQRGPCCAMAFDIESFFSNLDHQLLKRAWCKLLGTKSLPKDHYNIYKSITNFSYVMLDDFRIQSGGFNEHQLAAIRKEYGTKAFFGSVQKVREAIESGELRVYKNQYKNPKEKVLRGIPQGLPISALLANLYLLEFDRLVFSKVVKGFSGFYRRYSDDIVVICNASDQEELERFVLNTIKQFKLEISRGKTEVCFFDWADDECSQLYSTRVVKNGDNVMSKTGQPFQYLGFAFYGDKVLVKAANVSKFYRRMRATIKRKAKRISKLKDSHQPFDKIVYKRRLRRLYSHQGASGKYLPRRFVKLEYSAMTSGYKEVVYDGGRKYRGNYLSYIKRASAIMDEPAIKRQLRRHERVLYRELGKLEEGL